MVIKSASPGRPNTPVIKDVNKLTPRDIPRLDEKVLSSISVPPPSSVLNVVLTMNFSGFANILNIKIATISPVAYPKTIAKLCIYYHPIQVYYRQNKNIAFRRYFFIINFS